MNIRLVKREDIDRLKWDSCVHYSLTGNPYAYIWYLDNVAKEWVGLVEDDYVSVFPLVYNDKLLGFQQLYQPFYCQQHGIYSVNMISKPRIMAFWNAIPAEYKYFNIQVNANSHHPDIEGVEFEQRSNYYLELNKSYEEISSKYSKNLKRSLKRASKEDLTLTGNIKPERLVEMFKKHQGPKIKELDEQAYHAAHRIIYNALHRGRGFLSGVTDKEGNLLAAGFFLMSHSRIINLMPTTTPEGRTKRAMHLLIDGIIRTNEGRMVLLDFEGSTIPSIAKFYQSFGATEEVFYQAVRNELPWWMKQLLKFRK